MIAIMSDLIYRLASISMSEKTIDAGAFLFLQGDPVHVLHIVRAGTVHLVRHQPDGATAVLQRATEDKILAEASVYSDTYHCDGLAVSPTTVFLVPVVHVKRLLEADRSFVIVWAAYLARELQATRKRAEIMSLKTVKAKLEAWLVWNDGALPAKGAWKQLADDIGASPEALYREVARRRNEVNTNVGRKFP
ncbi:Crp/Fnr family transcriptional regulator [Agrobacterium genomosp. 3 str. CIP 111-78]|uniref:Crp/Fnr family transcriptional regulator n=2 Tax=Agrobacterium TaxID=357 RepID=A0AAE6BS62_AGRTU|nr:MULTISPECIES: Crp/Fnr family transcriptional regulator [Agrobacterium tumefaciens complex]KNY31757.1 cAMP-binding proteins - catabolite gene activator and regulatory subunit of cAMP-dependent protein kinase [Agrobacterium sp. SUL3]MCA2372682.1 Crp/Fnr family transcriptional regulator [Agrobacterium tomkonis CIP 111-78]QCM03670.1 Crp/Fnr family transcriptional regulator [Agrobacterium tumefaciens]